MPLSLLPWAAPDITCAATANVAVGPQYDSTHVYVAPDDFNRFVASSLATFGGSAGKQVVVAVTPTPSSTISQLVTTPVGMLSVFGFKTPIPFLIPSERERTGYLVTRLGRGDLSRPRAGADVLVGPFKDPIGTGTIIQWPGGVNMQLDWHTTPPSYPALRTIPEDRVYVSTERVTAFTRSFLAFPRQNSLRCCARAWDRDRTTDDTYRRIRIDSMFGKMTVLVTDGHLPYPYGRETTGYGVADLTDTLAKAKAADATILAGPYMADQRSASMVQFPGGCRRDSLGAPWRPAPTGDNARPAGNTR